MSNINQEPKWTILKTQNDIDSLMDIFGNFHDGCLKELRYISGAYVHSNLSMRPINTQREVSMLIQRQYHNPSTIELVFEKVQKLNLEPADDNHSCEISCAFFKLIDGIFYWSVSDWFDVNNTESSKDVWISSIGSKWRIVDQYLGSGQVYINK